MGFSGFHLRAQFLFAGGMGLQVGFEQGEGDIQFSEAVFGQPDIAAAQLVLEALVAAGLAHLALQRDDLAFDLFDDVAQAQQVGLGMVQLAQGFLLIGLILADPAGFLEHLAAVIGTRTENLVDAPLLHHTVGVGPQSGIHEQALDVLETALGLINEILALARTEDAAGHGDLVVLSAQHRLAIGEGEADFGHGQRFDLVGAVEDHIGHGAAAQRLGALLAQYPANRVRHVALAAAVGPDDRHHSRFKHELRPFGEALEPDHFQCFKVHNISHGAPGFPAAHNQACIDSKIGLRRNLVSAARNSLHRCAPRLYSPAIN